MVDDLDKERYDDSVFRGNSGSSGMKQLTETELYIAEKIGEEVHRLSLKFSYEMLHEGYTFLCPYDIQGRFYKKWEEYSLLN